MTDTAEREQELSEEREYEEETVRYSYRTPDLTVPLKRVSANMVREWARAALVPAALQRLYEMGMGVTQFKVPTAMGNVVEVPAPAAVQRAALHDVVSVGVPGQIGLTGEADQLPGVMAFGEWELDEARGEVHGASRSLPTTGGIEVVPQAAPADAYEPPPDHSIVEVHEGVGAPADAERSVEEHEVAPDPKRVLAAQILAKRRNGRVQFPPSP